MAQKKIISWLNQFVTARMPDILKEPLLYNLVNKCQRYWSHHNKTCRRIIKHHGKTYTTCRFEFPRPAIGSVILHNNLNELKDIPGSKSKTYSLPRRKGDEQWINDYNPAILLAWKGNMDLQLISTDLLNVQNYITGFLII